MVPSSNGNSDHPLNIDSADDMGDAGPNALYDIDGIENPASTVTALHSLGDKVICYIEVGAAGNYYSGAEEGIPVTYYAQLEAAGDLGSEIRGIPGVLPQHQRSIYGLYHRVDDQAAVRRQGLRCGRARH